MRALCVICGPLLRVIPGWPVGMVGRNGREWIVCRACKGTGTVTLVATNR